jgi:hypothetical protein
MVYSKCWVGCTPLDKPACKRKLSPSTILRASVVTKLAAIMGDWRPRPRAVHGYESRLVPLSALTMVLLGGSAMGDGNCSQINSDGVAGWDVVNDTAFAGGDIAPVHSRPAVSASACCELCAATPKCTCWTWVPKSANPQGPLCWVKDTSAGRERDPGRVSGCVCSHFARWPSRAHCT